MQRPLVKVSNPEKLENQFSTAVGQVIRKATSQSDASSQCPDYYHDKPSYDHYAHKSPHQ